MGVGVCVCACVCACARVCGCVRVRVCFICLDQLGCQGTSQLGFVKDLSFLCQVSSLLL